MSSKKVSSRIIVNLCKKRTCSINRERDNNKNSKGITLAELMLIEKRDNTQTSIVITRKIATQAGIGSPV